jgi:hypothetical protein
VVLACGTPHTNTKDLTVMEKNLGKTRTESLDVKKEEARSLSCPVGYYAMTEGCISTQILVQLQEVDDDRIVSDLKSSDSIQKTSDASVELVYRQARQMARTEEKLDDIISELKNRPEPRYSE